MVKKIKWTSEAEETYDRIIQYLESRWTDREIVNFILRTQRVLNFIAENPYLFRRSGRNHVHEALITTHNLLLYRVKPKHIELITFFDTRQNPKKKRVRKIK
jgi:plasmid stabilization system protein ParE